MMKSPGSDLLVNSTKHLEKNSYQFFAIYPKIIEGEGTLPNSL